MGLIDFRSATTYVGLLNEEMKNEVMAMHNWPALHTTIINPHGLFYLTDSVIELKKVIFSGGPHFNHVQVSPHPKTKHQVEINHTGVMKPMGERKHVHQRLNGIRIKIIANCRIAKIT